MHGTEGFCIYDDEQCSNCARLWNRDVNAASNIWKIADKALSGEERPAYLPARAHQHNHVH